MTSEPHLPRYRIYLLTVWQEPRSGKDGEPDWRFQLTDPHTGRRYGFAGADALLAVVEQLISQPGSGREES